MNPSLENLRPLHDPAPISWWPPAPAWWLLLLLLVVVFFMLWRWWQRNALQRAALAELAALERGDSEDLPAALNRLLKRYALSRFPGRDMAALSGKKWLEFLHSHGGFPAQSGQALLDSLYRSGPQDFDNKALIDATRRWIRSNRR